MGGFDRGSWVTSQRTDRHRRTLGEADGGPPAGRGKPAGVPIQQGYGHSRTVLVCDDRTEVRDAIRTVLRTMPRFNLVAEAVDRTSCLALVNAVRPDILILDVSFPGGGPDVASAVRDSCPGIHILVFSGRDSSRLQTDMLQAGADQFVLKTGRLGPLVQALDRAYSGG